MRSKIFKRFSNLTLKQARYFYSLDSNRQKQFLDQFLLGDYYRSEIVRSGNFLRMTSKTTIRNKFGVFDSKRDVTKDREGIRQEIQRMYDEVFNSWKNENETLWLSDRVLNGSVSFEFDAYIAINEQKVMPFVVAKKSILGKFLSRAMSGVNSQDEFRHDEVIIFLIRNGLLISKKNQSMAELTAKVKGKPEPQLSNQNLENVEYLHDLNRVVTVLRKAQYINRENTLVGAWVKHFISQYGERHKVSLQEVYQNYTEFRKTNNSVYSATPIAWIPLNQTFNEIVELTDQDLQKIEHTLNVPDDALFKIKLTVGVEERQNADVELIGLFSVAENAYLTAYTNDFVAQQPKMYYALDVVANYVPEIGMYATDSENTIKMSSLPKKESELQISDLAAVVIKGEVVVINQTDNQRVIPYNPTTISFEHDVESGFANFLQVLSDYMLNLPNSNTYLPAIEANSFIPEIRYKKIVIAPKTWQMVTSNILNEKHAVAFINQLRMHKVVPNLFSLLENGQKFPININSPIGQQLLKKSLIKNKFIYIVQDLELESSESSRNNTFVSTSTGIKKIANNSEVMFEYPEVPSLDWKTVVIVVTQQNIDAVLDEMLNYVQKRFDRYFFVRYIDTLGWQIRLRIPSHSGNIAQVVGESMLFSGVNEVLIKQYFPEKSRYGGDLISEAEEIFVAESMQTQVVHEILNRFSIDERILLIAFDLHRSAWSLNGLEIALHQSKTFHANSASILAGLQDLKRVTDNINLLTDCYLEELRETYNDSYTREVRYSLMHMRINRWVGINRTIENNMLVAFFKIMRKVQSAHGVQK